jgi:U3 small nucleolar RNA-associated protein 12
MRCSFLLLRAHHTQLVANSSMIETLDRLQRFMRFYATEMKDVMGFNMAAMNHLKHELETNSSELFKEAVGAFKEKQTNKRRRRM